MHIPDMLTPPVAVVTGAVAVAGLGFAFRKLERGLGERTTVMMGIMAAFVFAAQMVNFPVGIGVSGHLMGGVLAAVMLGPWAGAGVMGAVLIVQCLLYGDGGVTALGANFVNMGLIGSVGGFTIYAALRRRIGGRSGILVGAVIAAWFSVLLASAAATFEVALSGRVASFPSTLAWMTLIHAAIGLGEAIITGLVLRFVLLTRPDLIHDPDAASPSRAALRFQTILAGVGIALAVAVFLAPLACERPDGLEYVGQKLGFLVEEPKPALAAPLSGYEIPGLSATPGVATALAGVIGTLVVFGVAFGLSRVLRRERKPASWDETSLETTETTAGHAV